MKVSHYVVKMLQKFSPSMPIHKTASGVWTAKDVALKLLAQEDSLRDLSLESVLWDRPSRIASFASCKKDARGCDAPGVR